MCSFFYTNVDLQKVALKQEGMLPFLITGCMIRNIRFG